MNSGKRIFPVRFHLLTVCVQNQTEISTKKTVEDKTKLRIRTHTRAHSLAYMVGNFRSFWNQFSSSKMSNVIINERKRQPCVHCIPTFHLQMIYTQYIYTIYIIHIARTLCGMCWHWFWPVKTIRAHPLDLTAEPRHNSQLGDIFSNLSIPA